MPNEVSRSKRLRNQLTERADVGDGAEITDLVTKPFDAAVDDNSTRENIISPSLPSSNQNTFARSQTPVAIEDDLLFCSHFTCFHIQPSTSDLKSFITSSF